LSWAFDQFAHQLPAQALAGQETTDQDRVFGLAGTRDNGRARDRTDHRLARRFRFGGHQADLGFGAGVGQALGGGVGEFIHRLQETVADLFRTEQREGALQRRGIFGADRTDQQFTPTGCLEVFMPGRHAVACCHMPDKS
jgi:hypothetical protein